MNNVIMMHFHKHRKIYTSIWHCHIVQ